MTNATFVLEKINDSFQDLPYPGDVNLVYDNSGQHLECLEVQQAFQGKHWKDVPRETLLRESMGLSFMTSVAFKFYLPAYLSFVVEDFENSDVLPETTVQYLMLPVEADNLIKANFLFLYPNQMQTELTEFLMQGLEQSTQNVHLFIDRVSGLTIAQGQAIRYYLEHLIGQYSGYFSTEPQTAIDRYWFIFK